MNENPIITKQQDGKYRPLNEMINFFNSGSTQTEKSYMATILEKTHSLSQYIKKIKLVEDPKFLENQNKEYAKLLKSCQNKIEKIIVKTLIFSNPDSNFRNVKDFDLVTNQVDNLLEKVSDNIDILLGKKKDKKDSEIEEELKTLKKNKLPISNLNLKNKVQMETSDEYDIDNSYFPFIPKIKFKPYALKELSYKIIDAKRLRSENPKTKIISYDDRKMSVDTNLFSHPYKIEIETLITKIHDEKLDYFHNFYRINLNKLSFQRLSMQEFTSSSSGNENSTFNSYDVAKFSSKVYKLHHYLFNHFDYILDIFKKSHVDNEINQILTHDHLALYEIEYPPLEQSKLIFVETVESLQIMLKDILTYSKEIAVDLEHHSYESYLGFTCLMQISTRFADYIIDTIKLRPNIHLVNEVFCNPTILKVFHGADFDVEWLQKDFGVYLVNMFDTGQAARILRLPSFSLASLLSSICNISADKKYQTADWRLRPLPYEMVKYAREDTHYLLFIYDNLKKQLVQKALFNNDEPLNAWFATLKKSNELALKQYVKPFVKNFEYYNMLTRNQPHMSKTQFSVLKLIFKFRDFVARKLDLSPDCVLSRKNIFLFAKLTKYDAENFYMNLDKNSHIRNFIPDLIKVIEAKLIKNSEKIEKEGGHNFLKQSYESSYLEKMKSKIIESKNKVKTICDVSADGSFFSHVTLKFLGGEIKMNEKNQSKLFNIITGNEKIQGAKTTLPDYENLVMKFQRFSLIPYLKEKHPELKLEVKQIKKVEEIVKPAIEQKLLNTKRNLDIPLDMLDLTNYKKPQLEIDYPSDEDIHENIDSMHRITNSIINEKNSKNSKNIKSIPHENENYLKNMRESETFMKSKLYYYIDLLNTKNLYTNKTKFKKN